MAATKFEHGMIRDFSVNQSNFHWHSRGDLNKAKFSMDKIVEMQKIESMRKTMLMQEEIFKQQVRELHRIYNLQKKLMHELKNEMMIRGRESMTLAQDTTNPEFCIWPQPQFTVREDQRELSGSCSGESSRRQMRLDLERPFHEQNPSSLLLSQEQKELKRVGVDNDDIDIDLTLSIGSTKRPENSLLQQCSMQIAACESIQSDDVGSSSRRTSTRVEHADKGSVVSSSGNTFHQDKSRPHWLLQDLSLHRS